MDEKLSMKEFVTYSSPRYYRLIFPKLKPKTKNGDLLSALAELKRSRFITEVNWDKIHLTKKGEIYYKIIQKLLSSQYLNVPQKNKILDYRSETGRSVILQLIRFLSAKLDFNRYFRYLQIPVFKEEENEWLEIFDKKKSNDIQYLTAEGREKIISFLKKKNKKNRRTTEIIQKNIASHNLPIRLNLSLIKKFVKNQGLNRVEPLFYHFNLNEPHIFSIENKNFLVNLPELNKIKNILEEFIEDFPTNENTWLNDYFKLLQLPTSIFGLKVTDELSYTSKTDAFLNLAVEGPRIFAGRFSAIKDLGNLKLVIFPINPKESIVISSEELEMFYYFTIPTKDLSYASYSKLISLEDFPENYLTSTKPNQFGHLISRSRTLKEALKSQEICETTDLKQQKYCVDDLRYYKTKLDEEISAMSYFSASLITICQMITMKFNKEFKLTKTTCIYENGIVSLVDLGDADTILTSIQICEVNYGSNLRKVIKKIKNSMDEIISMKNESLKKRER
ncbi:MAG: hypothetical protein ACTSWX_02935 [Promethearchaeota archaeon]